jgi:predicted esterase
MSQINHDYSVGQFDVVQPIPFKYCYQDFSLNASPSKKELILLLHGFAQSGEVIWNGLKEHLPQDAVILAPHGLFPMAHRSGKGKGYTFSHAWDFYDFNTESYYVEPHYAFSYLDEGIKALGLDQLPRRIIGFSQGGWIAPFYGLRHPDVTQQVISIGCNLLEEKFDSLPNFRIDGIHGDIDDVVPIAPFQKAHQRFLDQGGRGEFISVPNHGHSLGASVSIHVRRLIDEARQVT